MSDTTIDTLPPARDKFDPALEKHIRAATDAVLAEQKPDGHWVYELEADATIPAEYVLMVHYFAETPNLELERKIGVYLRRIQGPHSGWPLFHAGEFDMSASVKAYFALKMIGDDIDAPHMRRAREAILTRGGGVKSNVFTRALLSLYGVVPWKSVPVMPVEIMLLPKWFPFHIDKISYWARTVIVPLLVLQALKPKAINPRGVTIDELFHEDPKTVGAPHKAPHQKWSWFLTFRLIDIVLRALEPAMPKGLRKRAIDSCVAFVTERLNGIDGLGAIYPAMENSLKMYAVLGYPPDHPDRAIARASLDKLLVVKDDEAYCQPCVSPVWDTALVAHALLEAGGENATAAANRGLEMDRARAERGAIFDASIDRAREWIVGLQSRDGGFGAFDADNDYHYLNNIPFADHGALLDPPSADLTARCLSMLAQLGERPATSEPMRRAIAWLERDQRPEGSWYGRWGMNYIYGTWSVLCALNAAGVDPKSTEVRKAVGWLVAIQNEDGGWGEDGASYKLDYHGYEKAPSTASQTAWALLGLMAAGEIDHAAVRRGVIYLAQTQGADGVWKEERYTATGFPRVFYLRYHGYRRFFPLWAMARYRNLKSGNSRVVSFGM